MWAPWAPPRAPNSVVIKLLQASAKINIDRFCMTMLVVGMAANKKKACKGDPIPFRRGVSPGNLMSPKMALSHGLYNIYHRLCGTKNLIDCFIHIVRRSCMAATQQALAETKPYGQNCSTIVGKPKKGQTATITLLEGHVRFQKTRSN